MLASYCPEVDCWWTPWIWNFELRAKFAPAVDWRMTKFRPNFVSNFAPNFKMSYSGVHQESIPGQCDTAFMMIVNVSNGMVYENDDTVVVLRYFLSDVIFNCLLYCRLVVIQLRCTEWLTSYYRCMSSGFYFLKQASHCPEIDPKCTHDSGVIIVQALHSPEVRKWS